jgi:LmbE family N-acetylglucosaminyl deacetylase
VLGVFAHPDDEVFCAGGTLARCAQAGAVTALVCLTRGEGGRIRDAGVATRRTLGAVRAEELRRAAHELGVEHVVCLDLGDGRLETLPPDDLAAVVRDAVEDFSPDVVITWGPDGGTGHGDHVVAGVATTHALASMDEPPRLLHARFPLQEQLMLDAIVDWLSSSAQRFVGTPAFGHALKLFADGSSMLGFAADHLAIEWFPAGSTILEQGEPSTHLLCILSGSADIVLEREDGTTMTKDRTGPGSFVGQDGLAAGRPRNAHVIARDDVTCLVLSRRPPSPTAARGPGAGAGVDPTPQRASARPAPQEHEQHVVVTAGAALARKAAALAAHRSQYALDVDLFPASVLERLWGSEHYVVVDPLAGPREVAARARLLP